MVTIIIPNYNGKKLLENQREFFQKLSTLFETIIVDNGSIDKSTNYIKSNLINVNLIQLKSNKGFTGACNAGALRAKNEWLLFLNNDCTIYSEDIKKLLSYIEVNKLIATQPIVRNHEEIENIGYVVDLKKAKAKTVTNYELEITNDKIWEKGYFYGLSATCLLIRKDIFKKVGMFDESFHSYLEDVDLFLRLADKGYSFSPCMEVEAMHAHMATSSKMGSYKQKRDLQNWVRIILKNYPLSFTVRNFPTLFIERLRNLNGLIKTNI